MSACVVLAAGQGRRLGTRCKATLSWGDGTFLSRVASLARGAGCRTVVCVAGGVHEAETRAEAERVGAEVVVNPDPGRGMASSIEVGFAALRERAVPAAYALLWPVDHVRVEPGTVRELCARATAAGVVIPTSGGRGGHPVVVGRDHFDAMTALSHLPQGARSLFRGLGGAVRRVAVDDAGVLADVDTPDDIPKTEGR